MIQFFSRNRACVLATAVAVAATSASAEIVRYAVADAGIREESPENAYGTLTPTELTVRVTSGQNRHSLMRFDISGLTVADLQGFADLRLTYQRNGVTGTTQAGGIKIYGLNTSNALASTWNEATMQYRDAGTHGDPSPSPTAQPSPGALPNAPVSPIIVGSPSGYGALPTGAGVGQNPNGTPGLRFETAPYSPNVNNLNVAAQTTNNNVFTAGTGTYTNYTNQPGYAQTTASGAFSDLITAGFDRPLATVAADVQDYSLLGTLNYDARATARLGGDQLSFSTGLDNSPINYGPAAQDANRAALVSYLTDAINANAQFVTFLVIQKNTIDGDAAPISSNNLIFASKEFAPTGGFAGQWAPQLIVAPEPGSMFVMLSMGAMLGLRKRR